MCLAVSLGFAQHVVQSVSQGLKLHNANLLFGKLIKWDFGKLGLVVKEEVERGDVLLLFYDRQETWGNLTLEKLLLSLGVTFHQCFGLENVFI